MPPPKNLGLKLYKLNISKEKFAKVNRGFSVPRHSLITLFKSLVRPHEDYVNINYDQPNNLNLCSKTEICQWNAALASAGAIRGLLKGRLHQELAFFLA